MGLVGCGAIAGWHHDAIDRRAERTTVTACIDPDRDRAEAMAARSGAQAFTSLDDALAADALDAALVMVPHHLHEEVALAVLAGGRHLLLEKPIAHSLEAAERASSPPARPPRSSSRSPRTHSSGPRSSRSSSASPRGRSAT